MKKRAILLLVATLLMTSCGEDLSQINWHITTFELADEYFPKYFEFVETSLLRNDIQYEKEYEEEVYEKYESKIFRTNYIISESMYYCVVLDYDKSDSDINCDFKYKTTSEDEALNIPQKYINVMIDVVNFCSNNYQGKGEQYNTYIDTIRARYESGDRGEAFPHNNLIQESDDYLNRYPGKGAKFLFNDKEYKLVLYLSDYLTDVNIWDR